MLAWVTENLATILIGTALTAVVAVILVHMVKNKKKGGSSCGCGCAGCPMSGTCHKEQAEQADEK